jgi:hypothetical protein
MGALVTSLLFFSFCVYSVHLYFKLDFDDYYSVFLKLVNRERTEATSRAKL